MDFQLGESSYAESFASGPGGDGSQSAKSVNLLQNVISDNLAISEVRSNDGHDIDENRLKLDLDQMQGDDDAQSGGGSKKSKGSSKKKKKKATKEDKTYRIR